MPALYLISNDDPFEILLAKLQRALEAGIDVFQYRRKNIPLEQQYQELDIVVPLMAQYNVQFVMNDNLQLAKHYQTGLHLGQGDGCLIQARQQLGENAFIGRTCHGSVQFAEEALQQTANYVAFGAVYSSSTKTNANILTTQQVKDLANQFQEKSCFIGGLSLENIKLFDGLNIGYLAIINDILGLPIEQVFDKTIQWQSSLVI